ncbi:pentapeptide repeat-containing protein (plasmid) [Rhodococcus qingshengii]|uniref:pentapeptide repeat-containing protein n=1 Tax=Rhodococcus qingshengii TaxID=334542 RepID=UPI002112C13F|nr:pentapeptide repeat-containing protein [Rhodococcus qingshengii]UUE28488.1 pentapeptide repeat-containing protein [Rhodococcus qingshengii]
MKQGTGEAVSDDEALLPAELLLLKAVREQRRCDLIDPAAAPTASEIAGWDDSSRMIRADVLRRLLLHGARDQKTTRVDVRGAIITGDLDIEDTSIPTRISLEYCQINSLNAQMTIFTESVSFSDATFSQNANFNKSTFSKKAWFDRTTFTRNANFNETTFTQNAAFNKSTFTQNAAFKETTFTKNAWFERTTFTQNATFNKSTFTEDAAFRNVKFSQAALFRDVTFTRNANFTESTFTKSAAFDRTTFTRNANFKNVIFSQNATFNKANFAQNANFNNVTAHSLSFNASIFDSDDLGAFACETLTLTGSKFHNRVRFTTLCKSVDLQQTQFDAGGHLQIHGARILLKSADILARTVIADPGRVAFDNIFDRPDPSSERAQLLKAVRPASSVKTSITDLRLANIKDLVLSSIDLRECRFGGAHGLDTLRIDSSCDLLSSKDLPKRWRLPRSKRSIIAEEKDFRDLGDGQSLKALDVATIYRDLRRGLETGKNEPGAADFYYGEMEMRRHSAHEETSRAERVLLSLYWGASGYGLRASRSVGLLVAAIVGAGIIFSTGGIAEPSEPPISAAQTVELTADVASTPLQTAATENPTTAPDPATPTLPNSPALPTTVQVSGEITSPPAEKMDSPDWGDGFELAARNSVALLRNPGERVALTPVGTVTDLALRLATPVLLGLAILALRGRTKR